MTTASCEMVALVEAHHDRRLGALEAASLDRHLESCETCRQLAADLERMADLAHDGDLPPLPQLEGRRGRLRLLKAAARPHREGRRGFGAWQLAAATFLCGGVAAAAHAASSPPATAVARSNEIARAEPLVIATPGAQVRHRAGLIEIDDGAVAVLSRAPIRIRYGETEYRVEGAVVVDGARARVEHVIVTSGALTASGGEGPPSLGAGGEWRAPEATAPEPSPRGAAHVQPAESFITARAASRTALVGGAPPPSPVAPREAAPPSSVPPPDPAPTAPTPPPQESQFTEGVRLIERGSYAAAKERLEAFRRGHPGDARAEDAAFLEIVALDRSGRRDDARAAARRYLATYPNGFRRAEAEALAR